jgi:hypothetical protein
MRHHFETAEATLTSFLHPLHENSKYENRLQMAKSMGYGSAIIKFLVFGARNFCARSFLLHCL